MLHTQETPDSKFRKSKSASRPPLKQFKGKLRRTLKRGAGFRAIQEDDWPWLWGAYRTGAFDDLFRNLRESLGIEEVELTPADFRDAMEGLMILRDDLTFFILEATVAQRGMAPVGLVSAAIDEFRTEPHVVWFRWSTPRNRIEAALKFLHEMSAKRQIVIYAEAEHERFYKHLAHYGPIRAVGKIWHFFGPNKPAMIWASGKQPDVSDVG